LAVKKAVSVSVAGLCEEPYVSVLCYPKPSKVEAEKRLKELQRLGISALEFNGEKEVFGVRILGKGYVGVVVKAFKHREIVALKIRRVDADRLQMQHESQMLERANSVGVGPELLGVSKNFLVMQFVGGDLLPRWFEKTRRKVLVRRVLRGILEQCWRMDEIRLDHGELSDAPKHVIVNERNVPVIVDFETASVNRRPSNVTSICQFLFFSGEIGRKMDDVLGEKDKNEIVEALRRYKRARNREDFERILEACGV
jgi:putative serine/threonine protein kinase